MVDKRELIRGWFEKAGHDLGLAELALKHRPDYADLICYHAQQAAEKCVKALLAALDIPPPRTHNLAFLVDLAVEARKEAEELYELVEQLESYAVEARYPDAVMVLTVEDARQACEAAAAVRDKVKDALAEYLAAD